MILNAFFFCRFIFGVVRSIDVLDPENQPRSGKIRTVKGADIAGQTNTQKNEKGGGLKSSLIFLNIILEMYLHSRYRAKNLVKNGFEPLKKIK